MTEENKGASVNIIFYNLNISMSLLRDMKQLYDGNPSYNILSTESGGEVESLLAKTMNGVVFFGVNSKEDVQSVAGILKKFRKVIRNGTIYPVCLTGIQNKKLKDFLRKRGTKEIFDPIVIKAKTLSFKMEKWTPPMFAYAIRKKEEEEYKKEREARNALEPTSKQSKRPEESLEGGGLDLDTSALDNLNFNFGEGEFGLPTNPEDDPFGNGFDTSKLSKIKDSESNLLDKYMSDDDDSDSEPNRVEDKSVNPFSSVVPDELKDVEIGRAREEEERNLREMTEESFVTVEYRQKKNGGGEMTVKNCDLLDIYDDEVVFLAPKKSVFFDKDIFVDVKLNYKGEEIKLISMGKIVDIEKYSDEKESVCVEFKMVNKLKLDKFMELFLKRQEHIHEFMALAKGTEMENFSKE